MTQPGSADQRAIRTMIHYTNGALLVIAWTYGMALIGLPAENSDDKVAQDRQSWLGALMGYATGLEIGAAYRLVRPHLEGVSIPLTGIGIATMVGSDVPAITLEVTDRTTWELYNWASGIIPHLAYGLVTAVAYEVFTGT